MTDLEYIAEYKQKCKEVVEKFEYISSIVEKNKNKNKNDAHIYLSDSIQKKLTAELKLLDDELILKLEKYYEEFIKTDEEKEDEKNEKSFWEDFWEENDEDDEDEDEDK